MYYSIISVKAAIIIEYSNNKNKVIHYWAESITMIFKIMHRTLYYKKTNNLVILLPMIV